MEVNDVVEIDPSNEACRFYGSWGPFTIIEVHEKVDKNDKNVSDEVKEIFKRWGSYVLTIPVNAPKAKLVLYPKELKK